jgi:hypothetical protein
MKWAEADELVSFLLDRIAERRAAVAEWPHDDDQWARCPAGDSSLMKGPCTCGHEAEVKFALARCESDRLIVENYSPWMFDEEEYQKVLAWLAMPYAEHPDYRQEW